MNIFKRIQNLWRISGYHFTKYSVKDGLEFTKFPEGEPTPHKPAQIIKRQDVVDKFLQDLKNE